MKLNGKVIDSVVVGEDITTIFFDDGDFLVVSGTVQLVTIPESVLDNLLEDPPEEKEKETPPKKEKETPPNEEDDEEDDEQDDEEEETGDEFWTLDEIEELTKKELLELIEDEKLDVDTDIASTKKLRNKVIEELGLDD